MLEDAERLGTSDRDMLLLFHLGQMQPTLSGRQKHLARQARALLRGRGWPTERIRVFFLSSPEASRLHIQGRTVGPAAVVVRPNANLKQILSAMAEARSEALPERDPAWREDPALLLLARAIAEAIARRITKEKGPRNRGERILEELRQEGGADPDSYERLAFGEVLSLLAESRQMSLGELGDWVRGRQVAAKEPR